MVSFDTWISDELQEDTRVALRAEMEKPVSTADNVDGYIYCYQIISEHRMILACTDLTPTRCGHAQPRPSQSRTLEQFCLSGRPMGEAMQKQATRVARMLAI